MNHDRTLIMVGLEQNTAVAYSQPQRWVVLYARDGDTVLVVTAKEKLLEQVQAFSEREAQEALRLLETRSNPVLAAFHDAPLDDEPWTEEDEVAAAEGRADVAAGRTVSLDEAMREFE